MDVKELYDRQHQRVYRLAMIYLKNTVEAEDTVQSIFIKIMEHPIEFESQEHENAWFLTVTKNHCKDVLKTFWRKHIELGEVPDFGTEEADSRDISEELMKLPAKYREVLYLYYYEEYSVREMSELLHRKESTIQTQLATARKRLKAIMERSGTYAG